MAYDLEQQDTIDELKAFWARWSTLITIVLTIALVAVAGWRGWGWWQIRQAQQAAALNAQMDDALRRGQLEQAAPVAASLMKDHPKSILAALAALRVARAQVDANDTKSAQATLNWAVEHGADPAIRALAKVRLAGILLDQGQFDSGLKLLADEPPVEIAGLWLDRRGDLLAEQGKPDQARAAWKSSLDRLAPDDPMRAVVQLKFDTIGGGS